VGGLAATGARRRRREEGALRRPRGRSDDEGNADEDDAAQGSAPRPVPSSILAGAVDAAVDAVRALCGGDCDDRV